MKGKRGQEKHAELVAAYVNFFMLCLLDIKMGKEKMANNYLRWFEYI